MRPRDPLAVALVLTTGWLAAVAVVALLALRESPSTVAESVRREPQSVRLAAVQGVSPAGESIAFTVDGGMAAEAIAQGLAAAGVIADAEQLGILLTLSGTAPQLRAGCYVFGGALPATEVLRRLREGLTFEELLAIPEGLRNEQIGELLAAAGVASRTEWERAIAAERARASTDGRPEGASLLGYLLPASYPVACNASAEALLGSMREAFAAQFGGDFEAAAAAIGLTRHEVLTLASIVEREAVLPEEQPLIAAVFLNRLALGIALQADPTVQFAIASAESVAADGWWKTALTLDDLAFDSPYNSYRYPGLPPGPIANPGAEAIRAVLRPAQSEFLYFVARGDGGHVFARTLDEHNANVARYLAP